MNEKDRLARVKKSNEKWLVKDPYVENKGKKEWLKEFKKRYGHKNGPR